MKFKHPLVLASSSPSRLKLLEQIAIKPDTVLSPEIDETPLKKELPKFYAIRMAKAKAQLIHHDHSDKIVIAADNVVCSGRRILHKTDDIKTAQYNIKLLGGRRHRIYSALCIITPEKIHQRITLSVVKFKRLTQKEIDKYLKLNEWQNKAGSYSAQGFAGAFIQFIRGSYYVVVGLDIHYVYNILSLYAVYNTAT